jgi:hypothetical protein
MALTPILARRIRQIILANLQKAQIAGLQGTVGALEGLAPHAQQKGFRPFDDDGNKLEVLFDFSRYLSKYVRRAYADDLDIFEHRHRLSSKPPLEILIPGDRR